MPDLSVVLGDRLSQIDPLAALNTVGPDLAVEVLSRDQGVDHIEERLDDYAKLGTAEVWLVNPTTRTVTGMRLQDRDYQTFAAAHGADEFHSEVLTGLHFSVGRLWMGQP
jgi:Uma2 family endonuclease